MASTTFCLTFLACVALYASAARPTCVRSCDGLADGDYQSCHGCDVYASCSGGHLYDDRPCAPGGLVWDDNKRRCEWNSSTCHSGPGPTPWPGPTPGPDPDTCTTTGKRCVRTCDRVKDGYYQSCYGCGHYVTCHANTMYDFRPCAPSPSGLVWDDINKTCNWVSNTCTCRVRQIFVCQRDPHHPEAPDAYLICPEDQKIQVVRANFGRTLDNNQICNPGYKDTDDTSCVSSTSLQRAKEQCDNEGDCLLDPTTDVFDDACPSTYKYLNISYVCEGSEADILYGRESSPILFVSISLHALAIHFTSL